jgi:hypothetical protein
LRLPRTKCSSRAARRAVVDDRCCHHAARTSKRRPFRLAGAFLTGCIASSARAGPLEISLALGDKLFLLGLAALIALFALPLPPSYHLALVWPRLAGAAMTLFGGAVTLVYAAATALGYR